ncbi:MAG: T9SS type A sorting domain-containing protein, partial [Candidatus Marinimicrobia bacterium]|nr:T9SS type A sorting domain-containing protein [Candidatus Neomarinimicrobiota bacterium]
GDNDGTTREHMIQWSAGHTDGAHSYPALCGTATFMDNHVLKLEAVGPRPQDTVVVNPNAEEWYTKDPTAAIKVEPSVAKSFNLLTNYPNPFNPSTTIKFSVPKTAFVTLKVHNTLGQEVAQLVAQRLNEGIYTVNWNAAEFPSGIYIVRMVAGDLINTSKMVLLK